MGYSREQGVLEPIVGIRDIPGVVHQLPATPGALGIAVVPH